MIQTMQEPDHSDSSDHYTLQLERVRMLGYRECTRLAERSGLAAWNRCVANYKIDYRSFTLPGLHSGSRNRCGQRTGSSAGSFVRPDRRLISFLVAWLLLAASLAVSFTDAQALSGQSPNSPNFQTANGASHSQSPRTVATKYGIVRGTIITLPNVNLQQVEAFLGKRTHFPLERFIVRPLAHSLCPETIRKRFSALKRLSSANSFQSDSPRSIKVRLHAV